MNLKTMLGLIKRNSWFHTGDKPNEWDEGRTFDYSRMISKCWLVNKCVGSGGIRKLAFCCHRGKKLDQSRTTNLNLGGNFDQE